MSTGSTAVIAPVMALLTAATVAFRIDDPRIDEASGIAPGIRSPGVVYVQNDSGDRNRFFAVNARTGTTAATVTVPGATNVDWEDVAVATDAAGTPSVWLADTGDNAGRRDDVRVYRVDEPRIAADGDDRRVETGRADVRRLTYPDGPQDAESLAVAPGGVAFVITKSATGASAVYRVPPRSGVLRRVATLQLGLGGLATGAAFSRDGRVLVVRTYTEAFVWRVRAGNAADAQLTTPTRMELPSQQQGEGIAVSGDRLLLDSEGVGQPVYSLPLPGPPPRPSASEVDPTPRVVSPPIEEPGRADGRVVVLVAAGAGVVVVLGLAALVVRRRRRG